MTQGGLNKEDTEELLSKLRRLRDSVKNDQNTLTEQRETIQSKERVIDQIYAQLQNIRKELLVNGGMLAEKEFRSSVAGYLRQIRDEVEYYRQNRSTKVMIKQPLRVVISGAAGQIGYSLIPLFANGQVFGLDQPLVLNLLEITPVLPALNGVAMEIEDGSYPLVEEINCTDDPAVAFKDVDYAILVGGFPRKKGMLRKDLLAKNRPIFESMGNALEQYAKVSTRVLVIANPANTNCLICAQNAPKIPKENFSALTRLDQNRAQSLLARKIGTKVSNVRNVIIWGNHSSTQVPDVSYATVTRDGETSSVEVDEKWVSDEFRSTVQQRGKSIIEARGFSSAMSAANAVKDCVRDWYFGTPNGEYASMAVYSNGDYDVSKGIFYSFPVTCHDGKWSIVKNLRINENVKELMKASETELLEERKEALGSN